MLSGGGGGGRECTPAALWTGGQQLALPFHQLNRNLVLKKLNLTPAVMSCGPRMPSPPLLYQKCFCNTGFLQHFFQCPPYLSLSLMGHGAARSPTFLGI